MSKSQHTPGPWEWWTSNSWKRLKGKKFAPVLDPFRSPVDGHPDLIVSDADMALIAAAPKLLAACKAALDVFELDCSLQYGDITDRLIEAITKAGGQP